MLLALALSSAQIIDINTEWYRCTGDAAREYALKSPETAETLADAALGKCAAAEDRVMLASASQLGHNPDPLRAARQEIVRLRGERRRELLTIIVETRAR